MEIAEGKRDERRAYAISEGGCLSIALHRGTESADDSEPALDRNPNHSRVNTRCGFGGDQRSADLAIQPDPFRQAPDANRENALGYSWPPHLYQGLSKLEENTEGVNARISRILRDV